MIWMFRFLAVLALSFSCSLAVLADQPLINARLVADTSGVKAGQSFKVGVYFEIAPTYHIYSHTVGSVGLPTKVEITLPEGYTVSPLRWPKEENFPGPNNTTVTGFSEKALVWVDVTPPSSAVGDELTITAKTSWLSCGKLCVPGKKSLELVLPLKVETDSANLDIFGTIENI